MRRYKKQRITITYPSNREETYVCGNRAEEKDRRKTLDKLVEAGALRYTVRDA